MTDLEGPLRLPGLSGGDAEEGLPLLEQLPRAQWRVALKPLAPQDRHRAARRVPAALLGEAVVLAAELEMEDLPPTYARRIDRVTVPGVDVRLPVRTSPRQVSFRISDDEYARLRRGAELVGLRPAQLARLLVLRGADGLVREYD